MFVFGVVTLFVGLAAPEAQPVVPRYVEERVVVYKEYDGKQLRMTLFGAGPVNDGPQRPAVLLVHGGAWLSGWRVQLAWLGRTFAQAGYVAASMDYRKLPSHGYPACVIDAKTAVRYLRAHAAELGIDSDRIVVAGHSAGGYIAMMLAVTNGVAELEGEGYPGISSDVQAALSMYGALDLSRYGTPREGLLGAISHRVVRRFLRDAEGAPETRFKEASPGHFLSADTPPVLLVHGTRDKLVPFDVSAEFHEALRKQGVPTRLVAFEGYNHGFDRFNTRTRPQLFQELLRFLKEHGLGPAGG